MNSSSTLSNQAILEKEQLQQQIVECIFLYYESWWWDSEWNHSKIQRYNKSIDERNQWKETDHSMYFFSNLEWVFEIALETTIAEYNSEAAEEMKQELIKKNKEIITLLGYIQQLQSDSM